ncbi:D-amino-acid transaminase [Xanthobacter tagetidis]|jgi:D-alanine transaminase|uniref:Probable branched-chain-amino-acid aminotransferase n=1 Tax=Xanthobacter tagetidis TaxID=60216 RepID=A0A3L7AD03_9HYPH|nr:D-amino-acid transaminase [Xanthobacter tagetidis]MBB6309724.1 D-alanine transaminase [Xanthobacter tagetidis]RLP78243.1 D-amino-acid transaminase [Xanthobacter tagetidis]
MSRIAYVNGRYVPHRTASVHVEDRGYQFSDGVYEVCEVRGGHLVDARRHLDRLERSLSELRIAMPMGRAALMAVLREVVARNGVKNGIVYLQATRGVARRDHAFPAPGTAPSLVVTARRADMAAQERLATVGVHVICVPENRWPRVDIKTVGLLPNVLAKQQAKEAGAREAWFVDAEGHVTEGSSTNAWIVTGDGQIVTRPAESGILKGITRAVVMEAAKALGLVVVERAFTPQEAYAAREAFITAASTLVMPVVEIDGHTIANGQPGSVARELRQRFHDFSEVS